MRQSSQLDDPGAIKALNPSLGVLGGQGGRKGGHGGGGGDEGGQHGGQKGGQGEGLDVYITSTSSSESAKSSCTSSANLGGARSGVHAEYGDDDDPAFYHSWKVGEWVRQIANDAVAGGDGGRLADGGGGVDPSIDACASTDGQSRTSKVKLRSETGADVGENKAESCRCGIVPGGVAALAKRETAEQAAAQATSPHLKTSSAVAQATSPHLKTCTESSSEDCCTGNAQATSPHLKAAAQATSPHLKTSSTPSTFSAASSFLSHTDPAACDSVSSAKAAARTSPGPKRRGNLNHRGRPPLSPRMSLRLDGKGNRSEDAYNDGVAELQVASSATPPAPCSPRRSGPLASSAFSITFSDSSLSPQVLHVHHSTHTFVLQLVRCFVCHH